MMKVSMLSLVTAGLVAAAYVGTEWTAAIKATDGSELKGTATLTSAKADSGEVQAQIGLTGAKPAAKLTWMIRQSDCKTNGPVLGKDSDYPSMMADSLGNATAKAEITARPDTGKVYSVAVKNDASAIIACGNFTKR